MYCKFCIMIYKRIYIKEPCIEIENLKKKFITYLLTNCS